MASKAATPVRIAAPDFNGDGKSDLLAFFGQSEFVISVLRRRPFTLQLPPESSRGKKSMSRFLQRQGSRKYRHPVLWGTNGKDIGLRLFKPLAYARGSV